MKLRSLPWSTIADLDDAFRRGERDFPHDVDAFPLVKRVVDGDVRVLDTARFEEVVDELLDRYDGQLPAETDAWLAPRMHAALRLTRQEASDPGLWAFLAVAVRPDYVRRRWAAEGAERFASRDRRKQAFARLWWAAEVFRNGPDYAPVQDAFTVQDIVHNMLNYDCLENRPLAIAMATTLAHLRSGQPASSEQVRAVGRTVRLWLGTTSLDNVAPDTNSDPDRVWTWVTEAVPAPIPPQGLPKGPDDGEVDPSALAAAIDVVKAVVQTALPTPSEAVAAG